MCNCRQGKNRTGSHCTASFFLGLFILEHLLHHVCLSYYLVLFVYHSILHFIHCILHSIFFRKKILLPSFLNVAPKPMYTSLAHLDTDSLVWRHFACLFALPFLMKKILAATVVCSGTLLLPFSSPFFSLPFFSFKHSTLSIPWLTHWHKDTAGTCQPEWVWNET